MKIIINGEQGVLGRVCSYAAKQALSGNEIVVVNSEKVIVSGSKKNVLERYRQKTSRGGHSLKGPKVSKQSFKLVKKAIIGMIPDHREGFGKQVSGRIKCYNGIPKEFEREKMVSFKSGKLDRYIEVGEISKLI